MQGLSPEVSLGKYSPRAVRVREKGGETGRNAQHYKILCVTAQATTLQDVKI